jgi:arylformamidase
MPIFDCSVPLRPGLVTWPDDTKYELSPTKSLATDGAEVSRLTCSTHTGTHIDAPRHFVPGGAGIDALPLEALVGPALVIDLTSIEGNLIEPDHLAAAGLAGQTRVLFKTRNSERRLLDQPEFTEDYVCLSLAGARWLVKNCVKLVGSDYLSVETKGSPGHPVHVELLKNDVVNLEGVRLSEVPAGEYQMAALPLRLVDADGSPARVVVWTAPRDSANA